MCKEFIQDIKNKLTMVDCVSYYWGQPHKILGQGVWWNCELHGEKTPSFRVLNNKFKCYGCHEYGDIFDFIRKNFNIEKDFDIAVKLNYDFNLGFNFDREETFEEKNKRLKLEKQREKEKNQKKNLKNFTREVSDKIIKQLRFYEKIVFEYGEKPIEWLYKESEIVDLTIYAYNELDRLDYLYGAVNELYINHKSIWHEYYGENSTEILREIYKGNVKINE